MPKLRKTLCGGSVSSYTERAQKARDCFTHYYKLTDGNTLPYQLGGFGSPEDIIFLVIFYLQAISTLKADLPHAHNRRASPRS